MVKLWTFVPFQWTTPATPQSVSGANWTGALAFLSVSLVISYKWYWRLTKTNKQQQQQHASKEMVIINTVPKSIYSPFALKMQVFLAINRVKYTLKSDDFLQGSFTPWVSFNGKVYRDVNEALHEISQAKNIDMDQHLTKKEKASARALVLTLEHHLYWLILIHRWVMEKGQFMWEFLPSQQDSLSFLNKTNILCMSKTISTLSTKVQTMSQYHGLGHLGPKEVILAINSDLGIIEDYLADHQQAFIMGDSVSLADCSVLAFLLVHQKTMDWKSDFEKSFPKSQAYVVRMMSLYFPSTASHQDDFIFSLGV